MVNSSHFYGWVAITDTWPFSLKFSHFCILSVFCDHLLICYRLCSLHFLSQLCSLLIFSVSTKITEWVWNINWNTEIFIVCSSCCPAVLEILPPAHPQSPHSVIIIHKRGAATQSAESHPAPIGQNSQIAPSPNNSYIFTLDVKCFAIPSKQKTKQHNHTYLLMANSHQSYPAGVLWHHFLPSNIYQFLLEETKAFHGQMEYNVIQALNSQLGVPRKPPKGGNPHSLEAYIISVVFHFHSGCTSWGPHTTTNMQFIQCFKKNIKTTTQCKVYIPQLL